MKKFLLQTLSVVSVSIGLSLVSCSDDYQELVQTDSPPVAQTQSHKLTLRQAMDRSVGILSESKSVATRSVDNIKSVDYITSPLKTRANTSDTLFYLVNFENDEGFLLMTTDDRLLPVYAFSDTGSLNLTDTTYNVPLRNYMNGVANDVSKQMSTMGIGGFPSIDIDEFEKDKYIAPMLSVFQSRIGQRYPFNEYCPTKEMPHMLVGCVPVAAELIMSYHRYPLSYKDDVFDWETMNNGSNTDAIAHLLAHLGSQENLAVLYGFKSSSASSSFYKRTFINFGYHELTSSSFATDLADRALYSGPIIVCSDRHAWVIDGLRRFVTPPLEEDGERFYLRYFHCVWGWDGYSNGFFYIKGNEIDAEDYYYWDDDLKTGIQPEKEIVNMYYNFWHD